MTKLSYIAPPLKGFFLKDTKIFADGSYGIAVSNGQSLFAHTGSKKYLSNLLKKRYAISF